MCPGWWVHPGRCCAVFLQLLLFQQILLLNGSAPPSAPYIAPRAPDIVSYTIAGLPSPEEIKNPPPLLGHQQEDQQQDQQVQNLQDNYSDKNPPFSNYKITNKVLGGAPGASSETPRNTRSTNLPWTFRPFQVCHQLYNGNSQRFLQLLTDGSVASTRDQRDPNSK